MSRILLCAFILLESFTITCDPVQNKSDNKILKIGVPTNVENNSATDEVMSIYKEAFKRMGREVEFIYYPNIRSLTLVNNGDIDIDLGRAKVAANDYKNIVFTNTPIYSITYSCYSLNPNIKVSGWNFLGKGYNIAIRRGLLYIEQSFKNKNASENLIFVNIDSGFQMLKTRNIDIYIDLKSQMKTKLAIEESIYYIGDIESVKVYPALNIEHKDLVPELDRVLTEMISEGIMKK